jgi:hypothetical protein
MVQYNVIKRAEEKDYELLQEKGFFGIDASLEESLEEYNLAISYNSGWGDIGDCTVLYRSNDADGSRTWKQTYVDGAEICAKVDASWFDKKAFFSFIDSTDNDWKLQPLVHQLYSLIQYYGVDNIL